MRESPWAIAETHCLPKPRDRGNRCVAKGTACANRYGYAEPPAAGRWPLADAGMTA